MFFQILTYNNCYQYDIFAQALCWKYYSKPKNLVVILGIQFFKEPNFEFKIEKIWKISKSGGYFQVLTHDNYEQTNGIQLEFFYISPMLGIQQQTKELSITHFKNPNFEFKSWKKKEKKKISRKILSFFPPNFKRKINLNK